MADEHDEHEATYGLVMPFVVCQTNGGPYEDSAFVAGSYFGEIDAHMRAMKGTTAVLRYSVPEALMPQIDLLAMHHRYRMTAEEPEYGRVPVSFYYDESA